MLLNIAYGIYLIKAPEPYLAAVLYNLSKNIFPWQIMALNGLMLAQILSYCGYSLYKVRQLGQETDEKKQSKVKIIWLQHFLAIILGLNILLVLSYSIFTAVEVDYYVTPILFNVFYFWVVYKSFHTSEILANFHQTDQQEEQPDKKYSRSLLKEDQVQTYKEILARHLQENQTYINPDLTLTGLAQEVNILPHHLSQVINQEFNQNFFDFINFYRIEKAKALIKDSSTHHLTLEAIGKMSGFGSSTSFYRAFKKHTGITPSTFLKV